ncbi:hypothetical protein PVAP13_2KG144616 [Panicum virgatum]|uniref:Uncharacterized protein n=1 Tax=Panicum virgatum TaxID=38727 RepID=A0A8T0W189_PANVG|nr:hypothetical protein PVAP13_2KG144616 [Panicum virgatum]
MAGSREAAPEAVRGGSADRARRGEGGAWCGRRWSTARRGRTVGEGEGRARRAGGGPRLGEGAGWREGLLSSASPLVPAPAPPPPGCSAPIPRLSRGAAAAVGGGGAGPSVAGYLAAPSSAGERGARSRQWCGAAVNSSARELRRDASSAIKLRLSLSPGSGGGRRPR